MKFNLATGLLVAQHLVALPPPTSSAERTALKYGYDDKDDENVLQLLLPLLQRYLGNPNNNNNNKSPPRREHTVPVSPSRGEGVLQNSPFSHRGRRIHNQEDCDPLSYNPDVGIFSCTASSHCEPVKDSRLGGKCVATTTTTAAAHERSSLLGVLKNRQRQRSATTTTTTTTTIPTSRHLVVSPSDAGVCLPDHPAYQTYECDCSGFDNVTGTGLVPCVEYSNLCLGELDPGCEDTCVTVTLEYSFTDFSAPGYTNCFTVTTPYSQTACFEERFEEETCTLTFNNVTCNSCEIVPQVDSYLNFDCSNAGGLKGSTVSGLQELLPILKRCSALDYCDLCGSGQYVGRGNYGLALTVPAPAGYEETLLTCGDLTYSAYENVTMDRDMCTDFAETAQTSGCCVSTTLSEPTPNDCQFCGEDREFYQDTMVEVLGYTLACADFTPLLNDTACDLSGPLLAKTCCAPEPVVSSVDPTAAPVTPPANNPTSSGATPIPALWVSRWCLLVVSLTVGAGLAATAGCWG